MSAQSYLDTIEARTGSTPRQLVAEAVEQLENVDQKNDGVAEPPTGSIRRLWLDGKDTRP